MTRYRRMRDSAFRAGQWRRRYEPHIEPVNRLVDELRRSGRGWMPYVDSLYGGVNAEVLVLFQDPGPGTNDQLPTGSGFLSPENDDPSAQLFSECLEAAGLARERIITWNAYPWGLEPGQKGPTATQLEAGVDSLRQLLERVPKLKVILAMGRVAQNGWARFKRRYPERARRYVVLSGLHTSGRGITNGGQHSKAEGIETVLGVMRKSLQVLSTR